MSLAQKIIKRLMITTLLGTGVAYGWLYVKASYAQSYLEQRALVQQAREISDFIVIGRDGSVALNLPPRLSEAYNSVKSSYRYAVRDEACMTRLTTMAATPASTALACGDANIAMSGFDRCTCS